MNKILVTWTAETMIGSGNKITLGFKDSMEYHEFLQLVENAHKQFSVSGSLFSMKQFLKQEKVEQDVVDKVSNQYEHALGAFEFMKERVIKTVQSHLVSIEDEVGDGEGIDDIHTYLPSSTSGVEIQINTKQGIGIKWNVSEYDNKVRVKMNKEAREEFLDKEYAFFANEKEQMMEKLNELESIVHELNQKFFILERGW